MAKKKKKKHTASLAAEASDSPLGIGSMKQILLVRHAKSSWDDLMQKDFERPLNERGKKDAPAMAKRLRKEKNICVDAIVSSPAKRAISTASYFADEFDVKKKHVISEAELYEASVDAFYNVLMRLDNNYETVALFSHNPGITAFANQLTNVRVDDMPTCGVFAIRIVLNEWKDFKNAEKQFWFFDYPKNIS
jgi:phosphohistidine phosphatase